MGYNLALNLLDHGHDVVGYNRSPKKVDELVAARRNEFGGHAVEKK